MWSVNTMNRRDGMFFDAARAFVSSKSRMPNSRQRAHGQT